MKTIQNIRWAWFAVTVLTAMSVMAAESVVTRDSTKVSGIIAKLGADGVSFSGGQMVAWTNVVTLARDRAPLQAPGQRLVLRNGTALCGLVRRATSDGVVFCSVAAGELTVAWTNVSWIRFEPVKVGTKSVPNGTAACEVVKTDGTRRSGSLMMATQRQLLLKTSEGLEKVDTGEVAWLLVGPAPGISAAMTLRNGDRLSGPVTWQNGKARVDVNGKPVDVEQSAIERMDLH